MFKVNDAGDLYQNFMYTKINPSLLDLNEIPRKIDHKYNFKIIVQRIIYNLE